MAELLTEPIELQRVGFREALFEATPVAFVTPALIAINVLVFIAMCIKGVPFVQPNAQQVLPWGANFGPLTTSGEWWRLVTACFLHFGILHLGVNMYILLQVGVFTERLFGNLRYLVLYLIAGIGGNIAGLFIHPYVVGAGASGAIFGVYGGLLGFLLLERGVVPVRAATGIAKSAGIFVLYNLVAGFARPETDQVAHVGGLVTGFVAGCALAQPLRAGLGQLRPVRAAVVTLVFAAISVFAVRHLPARSASQTEWSRKILTSPSVTVGQNDRVVYAGLATEKDAKNLAAELQRDGVLQPPNVIVLLERNASGATLSIPLRSDVTSSAQPTTPPKGTQPNAANQAQQPWNDPRTWLQFRAMGPQMATAAGGPPLTIRLLDNRGEYHNQVLIDAGEVTVGARDRIVYSGSLTSDQAKAFGVALQGAGFLHDQGAILLIARKGTDAPSVSIPLANGAWQDAKVIAVLQDVVRKVAPAIGGTPATLRLLDARGQLQREVQVQ